MAGITVGLGGWMGKIQPLFVFADANLSLLQPAPAGLGGDGFAPRKWAAREELLPIGAHHGPKIRIFGQWHCPVNGKRAILGEGISHQASCLD